MMKILYNISSFKIGLKVLQNGVPCEIIGNEYFKPGKGLAFNRVRFREIVSGKILDRTLKSGEYLESADVMEIKFIYLYRNGEFWYFMNKKNFEQIYINSKILGKTIKWMIEQLIYIITFWNDIPILVTPPDFVHLRVTNTISIIKSASISSHNKLATVSTGALVKVPYFIQVGELIKINTNLGIYMSRVK